MDVTCLKNKHTEELVSKGYFREWCRLKTKINLPLIYISLALRLLNMAIFLLFDTTYIWIENNLTQSSGCQVSANNISCVQNFYSFMRHGCSKWVVYICMICLLLYNVGTLVLFVHTNYVIFKNFKSEDWATTKFKKPLVHRVVYTLLGLFARISIVVNVILRFLKNEQGVYIPAYVDNLIYYFVFFGFTWSILFVAQLIPYIGHIAVVMKMMVKDTVIVLLFIATFCIPYSQLFPRIINHKRALDECDPDWNDIKTTTYNLFLLLFNMFSFKTIDNDISSAETQIYVSYELLFKKK